MYDYVPGKSAWTAYGLPAEGELVPRFIGHRVHDVPTCRPGETPSSDELTVEVSDGGLVLAVWEDGKQRLGPATIRPHTLVDEIVHDLAHDEDGPGYLLVTTPDGKLLGVVTRDDVVAD